MQPACIFMVYKSDCIYWLPLGFKQKLFGPYMKPWRLLYESHEKKEVCPALLQMLHILKDDEVG